MAAVRYFLQVLLLSGCFGGWDYYFQHTSLKKCNIICVMFFTFFEIRAWILLEATVMVSIEPLSAVRLYYSLFSYGGPRFSSKLRRTLVTLRFLWTLKTYIIK